MQFKNILKRSLILPIFLFSLISSGQVGIGTATPEGALDINGISSGIVYPVVSLTNINTPTITNPQTGNLVDGTTVYNDATSGTGDDSVYPGIYVWNAGSPGKWVPQFIKRDQALYEQRTDLRPRSNGAPEAISFNKVLATPVAASSFTPKYSGTYLVEIKAHYGGGETNNAGNNNNNGVNYNAAQGTFIFGFNGDTKSFVVRSYSADNNSYGTDEIYVNNAMQVRLVVEETLTRGTAYPFTLTFNQTADGGFLDGGRNGSNGNGQGYITINNSVKCTVEFIYIGDR